MPKGKISLDAFFIKKSFADWWTKETVSSRKDRKEPQSPIIDVKDLWSLAISTRVSIKEVVSMRVIGRYTVDAIARICLQRSASSDSQI